MAYVHNGIYHTYEYTSLLKIINSYLDEGLVQLDSIVYVIRSKESIDIDGFCYTPIGEILHQMDIDCVYGNLDDYYERALFSDEEWRKLQVDQKKAVERLKTEELIECTVLAVKTEMEMWNS